VICRGRQNPRHQIFRLTLIEGLTFHFLLMTQLIGDGELGLEAGLGFLTGQDEYTRPKTSLFHINSEVTICPSFGAKKFHIKSQNIGARKLSKASGGLVRVRVSVMRVLGLGLVLGLV